MRTGRFFRFASLLALTVILLPLSAGAASEGAGALHWSGDKTLYDTRNNRMELIGHAAIHQNGESLFADKITFERDTKLVHATGNAVYVGKTALIQGTEMHFNLETRTGTILGGRVSTDQFTLSGERINKLGVGRFQAHRAEYSTCKDCPQSWTLSAADVDLELEGYAYLSNVTAKVIDAPAFWIPYMIVPIKTKRQTGLLMPQFGVSNGGFTYIQPFFWAINRWTDMTVAAGNQGGRGKRGELEGRYSLLHGGGQANFYYTDDHTFRDYLAKFSNKTEGYGNARTALHVEQGQELPFDIEEKLRIVSVSDSAYLSDFPTDVPGNGEAYAVSDFSLTHATDKVTAFLFARRYQNILTPLDGDPRGLDPKTVQVLPQIDVSSNDKVLFDGKLVGGLSLGATSFTRSAAFYDVDPSDPTRASRGPDYEPGVDPLRIATRVRMNPSLYTTIRPTDYLTMIPHLDYYQYFYDFKGHAPSLARSYLRFNMDLSTQIERIYDRDPNGEFPRVKHLIRPILNYSVIPYRHDVPNHPFTAQMDYARRNNFTGYNFDNEDLVPLDSTLSNANYFAPEGNALSYGFQTQLIRKRKIGGVAPGSVPTYVYETPLEWSTGQTFNFRELRRDSEDPDPNLRPKPLSRFYSLLTATFDHSNAFLDYYYIPYQPVSDSTSRHVVSTGANWIISKGSGKVLAYERSLGASYNFNRSNGQAQIENITMTAVYSLNDYIMPSATVGYDIRGGRWSSADTKLTFQSPSECWKLDLGYYQVPCAIQPAGATDLAWCRDFKFNLSLNLTGSGFGSVSDPKAIASSGVK